MKTFLKWKANKRAHKVIILIIAIILSNIVIISSIIIDKVNTSEWFTAGTINFIY